MSSVSLGLLIVDGQNDFCEGGSLPIEGGLNDMKKIGQFIKSTGNDIKHIIATMDHHPLKHVGNANMWMYKDNNKQVAPFTSIEKRAVTGKGGNTIYLFFQEHTTQEVKCRLPSNNSTATVNRWVPPNDAHNNPTFTRPQKLWPVHCTVGTDGHALHPAISTALHEWETYYDTDVDFIIKGDNPHIEEYSAVTWRKMDVRTGQIWTGVDQLSSGVAGEFIKVRSPLLDKIFKYATGLEYYAWQENNELISETPPEMDVLLVTGLAENICVCETYKDILGDIEHHNAGFMKHIQEARYRYYKTNGLDVIVFQVVIVDDLTTGWVDPNIDRPPMELVTSHITDHTSMYKWTANRAAAGKYFDTMVQMSAKYNITMQAVDKFYNTFKPQYPPSGAYMEIKSNGQKYIVDRDSTAKVEYISKVAYYKSVSNAPVGLEYADWGPVDPLDRMFYNQYLLPNRYSYMIQHYLYNGTAMVPPMTDMYTANYTKFYHGRGMFDFFGPNHIAVVVLLKNQEEDEEEGEFVVLMDSKYSLGNTVRFTCSNRPFVDVPRELLASDEKNAANAATLIGGSYVITPNPFRHAWCEATFFQSNDNKYFKSAVQLNDWETASLRCALRLAKLY